MPPVRQISFYSSDSPSEVANVIAGSISINTSMLDGFSVVPPIEGKPFVGEIKDYKFNLKEPHSRYHQPVISGKIIDNAGGSLINMKIGEHGMIRLAYKFMPLGIIILIIPLIFLYIIYEEITFLLMYIAFIGFIFSFTRSSSLASIMKIIEIFEAPPFNFVKAG